MENEEVFLDAVVDLIEGGFTMHIPGNSPPSSTH